MLICFSLPGFSQTQTDSLLILLHQTIDHQDVYVKEKLERIRALRATLAGLRQASLEKQFDCYNLLYHEYKKFIYDSAFAYGQKLIETAYRLHDSSRIDYARVKLGYILVSAGMFKESFDTLSRVSVKNLPDSTRIEFYDLFGRAHYDLGSYNSDQHYHARYVRLGNQYVDSARRLCKPGSYYCLYLTGLRKSKEGEFREAIADFETLATKFTLNDQQQAVTYYNLSFLHKTLGDIDKAIVYSVQSSLADLRAAIKETASMHELAKMLYDRGDIKNASVFIKQAMDDATYYGARLRKVEIGTSLPVIASAELNTVDRQRKLWLQYGLIISILSLLAVLFVVIIFRQLKKLKAAEVKIIEANHNLMLTNQQLREANKIKEEYIGYYFNVNSEYLDKIESFKKSIDQKLTAKKYDDIRFIINSINPKREREDLYVSFDKVFVKLFPDFVATFNSFFAPEDRIVLKEGQLLNTELRIFALIRMGITETEEIARILNYSVNTIYAYKTRIRSKSLVPNEAFDRRIMEIRSA